MELPASVRAQAEKAKALQDEVIARNTDKPAPAEEPNPAASPKPDEATQAAEREKQAREAAEERVKQAEHRYNVLQGKYNAEVPALNERVKQLDVVVKDLTEKLKAAPPVAPVTDDDRKVFGEDLSAFVQRAVAEATKQAVQSYLAPVNEALAAMRGSLESVNTTIREAQTVTTKGREETFWSDLDSLLRAAGLDFSKMNDDAEFIDWLAQKDDLTGEARHDLLKRAQEALDAQRASRFFINYAAGKPKPAEHPTPAIHPDQGPGGQPPAPDAGKVWTRAEIKSFYDEKARGKWRGREAEALRIEKDIAAANAQGRIRN